MNSSDDHAKDSGASPEGFCTTCSHKIASFEGLTSCPNCGSTGTPCSIENQVNVSINTHELRLLCIWAENWGLKIGKPDVVYGIATRLRRQIGDRATLTMADEFDELRKLGVTIITNHPAADQP